VVLIEEAERRQDDARAEDELRADLEVDQRGLERDFLGAVLELELGEETDPRRHLGEEEDVEPPELHREAFADPLLDEPVRVRLDVPTERRRRERPDEWPVVDPLLRERRVGGLRGGLRRERPDRGRADDDDSGERP
jgi:hypothetical protein